eukprot:788340_1
MGYSDITIKYTVSGYASGGPSSSPPYTTNGKCEFQVFNGLFTQVVSETTSTSASTYVMADNKIDFQAKVKTINDQQNTASNSDSIYVVLKASTTGNDYFACFYDEILFCGVPETNPPLTCDNGKTEIWSDRFKAHKDKWIIGHRTIQVIPWIWV